MSYILDALNRSQQRQELKPVPTLATSTPADKQTTGHRLMLGGVLLSILLCSAMLLWLAINAGLFLNTGEATPAVTTTLPREPPGASAPNPPAPANRPPLTTEGTAERGLRQAPALLPWQLAREQTTAPSTVEKMEVSSAPVAAIDQPALSTTPAATVSAFRREMMDITQRLDPPPQKPVAGPLKKPQPVGIPATSQAQGRSGPPIREQALPVAIARRLPQHKITLHAYSAIPAERFIIMNTQRMQEGEETNQGLRVKEIRHDGVVLEFEGQRFFKPL